MDRHTYTLDDPNADTKPVYKGTTAEGISGNNVVGLYYDTAGKGHGFLYNISTEQYTTLDDPLATQYTVPTGIDGNTVFGDYTDASNCSAYYYYRHLHHGHLHEPEHRHARADLAMGWNFRQHSCRHLHRYRHDNGHGFVATVPEPSSCLLALAFISFIAFTRRRRAKETGFGAVECDPTNRPESIQ